jgi:hypothetical protein
MNRPGAVNSCPRCYDSAHEEGQVCGAAGQALDSQSVGNVGLYYFCYRLSRRGWNAMPTARNARGVDLLIYSQDAGTKYAVQVKALSKRDDVPLGTHLRALFGDFLVVCRGTALDTPTCFVLTPEEVRQGAKPHVSKKDGSVSYWLPYKFHEAEAYQDACPRIGSGHDCEATVVPKPKR